MRTDLFIELADAIHGDKYFEMSAGQNEHGMLGHLTDMWPELNNRSRYPSFKQGVIGAFGIEEWQYSEIFYPKTYSANWKSSTAKAEKAHITADHAAQFLRSVAMLYEESTFEVGKSIPTLQFFPVAIRNGEFTHQHFRSLWAFSRNKRNLDYDLIAHVREKLRKQILIGDSAVTVLNTKRSFGYMGEYPSVPLALAEYFLSEIGWPDASSQHARIRAIHEAVRLPVSELRRMFATEYDTDGFSHSARDSNKLCYISPMHAYAMLTFLLETGQVSWRIAKRMEDDMELL